MTKNSFVAEVTFKSISTASFRKLQEFENKSSYHKLLLKGFNNNFFSLWIFFHMTLMIHRTAGERRGCFFSTKKMPVSSEPLGCLSKIISF